MYILYFEIINIQMYVSLVWVWFVPQVTQGCLTLDCTGGGSGVLRVGGSVVSASLPFAQRRNALVMLVNKYSRLKAA